MKQPASVAALTCAVVVSSSSLFMLSSPVSAATDRSQVDSTGARPNAPAVRDSMNEQTRSAKAGDSGGIAGATAAWSLLGPYGGDVQDVAVSPANPDIMLAGTAPAGSFGGSLFRSTDGGATWAAVPGALGSTSVFDIEFAPGGATVYAGSMDSVWKSIDGGATWSPLNLNVGLNDQVFDVAIDPTNASVIWAGVADAFGSQTMLLMRSSNGGTSWENRTPPLSTIQSCRAIAVNPSNPAEVFAGFGGAFGGGQLWVSSNNGLAGSWIDRSAGLPATPVNALVHTGTLAMVGGGQLFGSQNFGLYSTNNSGATWTPVHDGTWPTLVVNDIALDPNNSANIYIATPSNGVYRRVGGPWQFGVGGTGSLALNAVRFAPGSSSRIVLGANSTGILQSTNTATSFSIISTGISQVNIRGVAANPNNPSELAVAFEGQNNGGVYRSTNGGATWNLEPVPPTRYSNVAFAPNGTLYAISSGPSSIAPEGVYRRNGGGSWTGLGPDQGTLFESDLTAMAFSATNPNLFFVVGADFGVAGFEGTIWRTTTAGAAWFKEYESVASNHFVTDAAIVPGSADQTAIACYVDNSGSGGGGALRSINSGDDWLPSSAGLPALAQGNALSQSAADNNTFFFADRQFGANGGLYRTTDGGQTWSSTGFVGQVNDVVGDPSNAQVVYALFSGSPIVRRSEDGGSTFSPFTNGLTLTGFGNRLAHAPGSPAKLLLASSQGTHATNLPDCPADTNGSGAVDVDDLVAVILGWGPCVNCPATPCSPDIAPAAGNCVVDVDDLVAVILGWGPCP